MNKTPAWKESLKRVEDGEWDYDRKRAPFVFKVPRAWEEGLKMIEAGEAAHRQKVAAKHKKTPCIDWGDPLINVHPPRVWASSPTQEDREWRNRFFARGTCDWMYAFAGSLSRAGQEATAAEVRRFIYDVVQPRTGNQCQ